MRMARVLDVSMPVWLGAAGMIGVRVSRRASLRKAIPTFLSIDVEPEGFQLSRGDPPEWKGYGATIELAEQLRSDLVERFNATPRFGWYFRMDPQIAEVYGRSDHIVAQHPDRVARLKAKGDYFGVHTHLLRWCGRRRQWIHDVADAAWLAHCTRAALDAFAQWDGRPARRFRAGAAFLANEIVEVLDQCGVEVELSLEPVAGWWLTASDVATAVDTSPIVGVYADCRTAPRVAYRPSHHDFRVSGGRRGRRLVLVPLTAYAGIPERPAWWRRARRTVPTPAPEAQMLYPSVEWPSPEFYWDLVERQLESMRRPYLSIAIRTDAGDSNSLMHARRQFAALPLHPLAERLSFVDPLDIVPGLV